MEPTMSLFYGISVISAAIAFLFAAYLYVWVKKQPQENKRITEVAQLIREGANTFMKREYKILAVFSAVIAVIIFLLLPSPIWKTETLWKNAAMAIAYVGGTVLSAIAGKLGLIVASLSNGRSAEAAAKDIKPAFLVGFRGGSVMGLIVVGSAVLGVSVVLAIVKEASILLGFSFGASSLALFAKAGGGIFTKTADVAADLTGKVELGIAEDDPRNPAVIADNVGDNVGDVAGMGADLFDSNVAALTSALVIAQTLSGTMNAMMVLCYAALGLLASIFGIATARISKNGTPTGALNSSTYVTSAAFLALTAGATALFGFSWYIWGCSALGLVVGVIIGLATDYFTDDSKPIVKKCAHASKSGPAFTVLSGVSYGFLSALPAMIGIAISALVSYKICATDALIAEYGANFPLFGISMAAVGMLSIVAMIISNDAYGPIVDNARGLAEMGNLGEEAIRVADELDSAGNTVKAVTKGFSIGAAGLTVISLLGTFMSEANAAGANIAGFDIMNPTVFFGILVGAAIPAVFSAMLILAVDKNAQRMVAEIHRQFDTIPGLKEGDENAKPEYDKCIDVATSGSLRELIPAGLVAIFATIAVGFIGGPSAVGGFLLGNIVSGLLLSLFMSNAGGLWDNSKKYVEAGNEGGKGSEAHKAAVIGDTVGDPFKDTAGPSINTQITVVSLVASLLSAIFVQYNIFG